MVGVGALFVYGGGQAHKSRVEVAGERERDVRCSEGRHDLEADGFQIRDPVDGESGEPFELIGGEVVDLGVVAGVEGREAPAVPLGVAAANTPAWWREAAASTSSPRTTITASSGTGARRIRGASGELTRRSTPSVHGSRQDQFPRPHDPTRPRRCRHRPERSISSSNWALSSSSYTTTPADRTTSPRAGSHKVGGTVPRNGTRCRPSASALVKSVAVMRHGDVAARSCHPRRNGQARRVEVSVLMKHCAAGAELTQ